MNRQGSLRVREANKCTIKLPVSGKGPLATLSHGRGRKTSKEKSVRGRGRAKPAFITNLPLQSRAHSCNINPCMRMEPSRPGCCCPGDRGAHISPFCKQLARTQSPVCSRWHLENATIVPGREENIVTEELRKSPRTHAAPAAPRPPKPASFIFPQRAAFTAGLTVLGWLPWILTLTQISPQFRPPSTHRHSPDTDSTRHFREKGEGAFGFFPNLSISPGLGHREDRLVSWPRLASVCSLPSSSTTGVLS